MQTKACSRCSSRFAEDQIDDEFAGMCPRCLASVLQESHAGVPDVRISTVGGPAGPSAPVEPLRPGEKFGGYEILGVLGQGGMGIVYKARQTSLDRTVALKVLAPRIAGSAEFARRFDHEAKVLASINHPNVVQVHDFGREGDVHFLVMEYVDGESLENAFRRGRAEPTWILRILRDVARGLGRVHGVGIVHRDLKPANILIAQNGTAKIGDFGLAVESEGVQRLTEQGYFVGTPHYVSPEHAKGEKVDPRSDLYAVGVMLFEGFSGRPPFQASSPTAVLVKHIEEPAPPLRNAPRNVQKLVRTLLRKNPAERPASAAELESSLDRALTAPPESPSRMKRIGVAAAAAFVLSLGLWFGLRTSPATASALPWVVATSDAIDAGDVDAARRAVDAGLRTGDSAWAAQLGAFAARVAAMEKDRPTRRDDEEYGAYLCFSKGDWERGLPLIAAGDTSPWREIARKELSASPHATEVAEAWLAAAAKSDKPRWAEKMRERAWAWFSAAGARDRLAELDKTLECRREIDLIALANPEKFAVEGEFRVEKGTLRTPPTTPAARMAIPYLPPDNYDLELEVERRTGAGPFYVASVEFTGSPRKLSISVRRGRVTATADGISVAPAARTDRWRTPESRLIVVGSEASAFVVTRMSLRGTPALLPPRPRAKEGGWTNLLAQVDPQRDAVSGSWTLRDGQLESDGAERAKIRIPGRLPGQYDYRVTFSRIRGISDVNLILSREGRSFAWCMAGMANTKSGFGSIRGIWAPEEGNPSRVDFGLEPGTVYEARVEVRNWGLRAFLNGKQVCEWATDYADLSIQAPWRLNDENVLGLGTFNSPTRFHKVEMREASGGTNLLELVDPVRETVAGKWTIEQGELICEPEKFSRIMIPVEPPDEYDLEAVVERRKGTTFILGIVSGKQVMVSLDSHWNTLSGLDMLDGKRVDQNDAIWRGTVFTDGQPARILCSVRRAGIRVTVDGKTILDWKGSRDRLALHPNWGVPNPRVLWIGAWDGIFRIKSLTLMPAGGIGKAEDPSGQQNLVGLIDPARNAVKGAFSKEGGSLITPKETVFSRIMIPIEAPEEYELTLEAVRRSGGDMIGLGIVHNERQVMAVVGGQSGETGGLEMLDGLNFMLNKTRFEHAFLEVGKPFKMNVSVRKSGIEVVLDGKRVVSWNGDPKALSLYHEWRVPDRSRMFLASQGSSFEVRRLALNRLDSSGSESVDLLRWIELPRDAVVGRFQRTDDGILTPWDTPWARIQVPAAPPAEYDLTLQVERKRGGDSLNLGPIWNGRPCTLMIDAAGPEANQKDVAAIDMVDGKEFFRNVTTTKGPFLLVGKKSVVVVSVRKESIALVIDGRRIFEVQGSDKVRIVDGWKLPNPEALMVGSYGNAEFLIRSIELRPVSGVPQRLPAVNAEPVELLKQIDLDRDIVSGGWKRTGDAIQSSGVDFFSRVMVPVEPPEEYDIEVDVVRKGGSDDFYMGLVQGKTQFGVMLDAGHSTYSAVQAKIGELTRYDGAVFKDERPSTVLYRVRANGIDVRVDGRTILSSAGSLDRGSMFPQWGVPNKKVLFFGAHNSLYVIRRMKLIPLAPVRSPGNR
jgi:predicted Ser/Thr protein kinase